MPRDIVIHQNLSEETDEILSRIPPKFSKTLIILIVSIFCLGGVIFYLFQASVMEETLYFKLYPEVKKITIPYFSKIEKVYSMDGSNVKKGDTILQISNLRIDSTYNFIARENGILLYSKDFKSGNIVQESTPIGAIFSDKRKYILLGKVFSGDEGRKKNEISFLFENDEIINGRFESRDKEDVNIYSILPTKNMMKKSIAIDSLSFRKNNKSLKSVIMRLNKVY